MHPDKEKKKTITHAENKCECGNNIRKKDVVKCEYSQIIKINIYYRYNMYLSAVWK